MICLLSQYVSILSNDQQLCSRCTYAPSGNPCARRSVGGSSPHHRCVWETVAQKQTVLSNPRGPAHPVQHPPHLRGGQLSEGLKENTSLSHRQKKIKYIFCTVRIKTIVCCFNEVQINRFSMYNT